LKAAEAFVKSLEASGVTYVFGVPGEENLALLEALRKSSIEMVTTRDEQSAVFMAATIGRLTGRVGVALSTLGPGATNLVTGVAYAQLGGMPLLVITGQKPIKKSKQGKFQIIDVVGMMTPITKFSETIVSGDRVTTSVYQAVRTAENERPGAVHLEFPEDIAEEETDSQPIAWKKLRRAVPDQKSIDVVVEAVQQAKRPIIAIAAGANRKLIRKQLRNFIDKTGIPFVTTQMGKGVEDEGSKLYIGTTALSDGDYMHRALEKADLIIMVGHDITEKPPVISNAKIVHINFYPADIDDVYTPEVEVIGDISYALWAMSEQIETQSDWEFQPFLDCKKKLVEDIARKQDDGSFPMKPQRIVKDLRSIMPNDGILSLDNGMYKIWIARNYPAYEQNTVLLDNALATMGAGLPVGMATKLLNPDKKVVVVAGDGGFMMNLADLETARRLELDLTVIILNDNGYGMIKWKQEGMGLADYGLDFSNPDFVKLAESFGGQGYRVGSADEFKSTLEKCLDSKGIHLIEVPIDYSENVSSLGSALKDRTKGI
jgi:acetolactate synthase-1/2/3 large subunit